MLEFLQAYAAKQRETVPDNEGLVDVALCRECNDVVAAAQLGKSVALGVALELHTATACLDIHNPCAEQPSAHGYPLKSH